MKKYRVRVHCLRDSAGFIAVYVILVIIRSLGGTLCNAANNHRRKKNVCLKGENLKMTGYLKKKLTVITHHYV